MVGVGDKKKVKFYSEDISSLSEETDILVNTRVTSAVQSVRIKHSRNPDNLILHIKIF